MSNRKYPRIGHIEKYKSKRRKKCRFCEADAAHKVELQMEWTRGDDEVLFVCDDHKPSRAADAKALAESIGYRFATREEINRMNREIRQRARDKS